MLPTATLPVLDSSIPATEFAQAAQATIDARAAASQLETQAWQTQAAAEGLTQAQTTAEQARQATAQALPMYARIAGLAASGILTSTQGEYLPLPDFAAQWALRDYYDIALTEHSAADFVLHAQVEWETSGSNTDLWSAGCGYVFRMNARGDHYLTFLGSDGVAYVYRSMDHSLEQIAAARYNDTALFSGSASLMLAVQGDTITVFVDDLQILQLKDTALTSGLLGHAIASGTNKPAGTSCRMLDNELWRLQTP